MQVTWNRSTGSLRTELRGLGKTVLLLWFLLETSTVGQTYVINGEMEATYFSWTGEKGSSQTTKFVISMEGSHWLLKSEYAADWYWLVGSDGTNTYSVLVDPKAQNIPAPATVFSGGFPQAAFDTVSVPWLAFCSLGFLSHDTNSNSIPSLWLQAQLDPMAHVCSTKIRQFAAPPHLPSEVEWITSSNSISDAASNIFLRIEGASPNELKRRLVDYKSSVLTGRLLGRYHVLESTNFNGLTLPLVFELDAYGYLSSKQRDLAQDILANLARTNNVKRGMVSERYLNATYRGRVAEISFNSVGVALPEPKHLLSIADYRLSSRADGIDFVSYISKQWKPQVDAELRKLLETKKQNPSTYVTYSYDGGMRTQRTVRLVLLLVFLAPIIVWGVRSLQKNRHHEQ